MKKAMVLAIVVVLFSGIFVSAAETKGPPRYLWIQFEQIHPGKTLPYLQVAQMFREKAGPSPHYWLVGAPLVASGSSFALAYVAFLDDFANLQQMDTDFNKIGESMYKENASVVTEGMGAITSAGSIVAEFQPDLSLNVEKTDAAKVTHWDVTTYRLHPGTRAKFQQLLSRVRAIEATRNNPTPVLVYRLVIGDAGPVFLVIRPLTSLADLDRESPPPDSAAQAAVSEQFASTVSECVVTQTEALYRIMPALSHPPEAYVAANPGFWTTKLPDVAAAPAGDKKTKKPAVPAALKEKQ